MAVNSLHEPWPPELTTRLIELYEDGYSWEQISDEIGRPKESCRSKARSLTLTKGKSKGHNRVDIDFDEVHDMLLLNYTRKEIADELGICTRTLHRHIKAHGGFLLGIYTRQNRQRKREGLAYRWRQTCNSTKTS